MESRAKWREVFRTIRGGLESRQQIDVPGRESQNHRLGAV